MDKREAFKKARRYAKLVKEILPYKKAVLFGSYAYGKPCEYSDIDTGFYLEELDCMQRSKSDTRSGMRRTPVAEIIGHL